MSFILIFPFSFNFAKPFFLVFPDLGIFNFSQDESDLTAERISLTR
jgi:hypothetical protein